MTRKEVLEQVLNMEEVKANAEMTEVLEKILASVSKKRNTKTANQKANDEIVEKFYTFIAEANEAVSTADIMKAFDNEYSNQKVSSLVKKLVDAGRVERIKDGKKIAYVIAD